MTMHRFGPWRGLPILIAILALLLATVTAQAQTTNPCTEPLAIRANPTTIAVAGPDLAVMLPTGAPLVEAIAVGAFLKGVDPATGAPVATVTLARSALTLAPGTTDCYVATLTTPLGVPRVVEHVVASRFLNSAGASAWTAGNSFFSAGAPLGPASTRIK